MPVHLSSSVARLQPSNTSSSWAVAYHREKELSNTEYKYRQPTQDTPVNADNNQYHPQPFWAVHYYLLPLNKKTTDDSISGFFDCRVSFEIGDSVYPSVLKQLQV